MTQDQLSVLVSAHAVAYGAMAAQEKRVVPLPAALALAEAARAKHPDFAPACEEFVDDLRDSHGHLDVVARVGRVFRDAVLVAMAFVPCDIDRVDIHG